MAKPGTKILDGLSHYDTENDRIKIINQLYKMKEIGLKEISSVTGFGFNSLKHAVISIDEFYNEDKINNLINGDQSNLEESVSDVFIRTVEIGSILGYRLFEMNTDLMWCPAYPYWESPIYDFRTGLGLNVYHWAVKKFTEYGIDDGLDEKCIASIEYLKYAQQGDTLEPASPAR